MNRPEPFVIRLRRHRPQGLVCIGYLGRAIANFADGHDGGLVEGGEERHEHGDMRSFRSVER